jgi:hypothetical protein
VKAVKPLFAIRTCIVAASRAVIPWSPKMSQHQRHTSSLDISSALEAFYCLPNHGTLSNSGRRGWKIRHSGRFTVPLDGWPELQYASLPDITRPKESRTLEKVGRGGKAAETWAGKVDLHDELQSRLFSKRCAREYRFVWLLRQRLWRPGGKKESRQPRCSEDGFFERVEVDRIEIVTSKLTIAMSSKIHP